MQIVDADTIDKVLDEVAVADALRDMFRDGCEQPVRHHHGMDVPNEPEATLLLMPAWQPGSALGIKIATVFPGANTRGLPAVQASYLLLDAVTGQPQAMLDGARLTVWRTAAASALAARYLARRDAAEMVILGAGALAPFLVRAHLAATPVKRVTVWNRNFDKAAAMAADLAGCGADVVASDDLEGVVRQADLISCATLSQEPLVKGEWLKPGAHLDLVGGFTPVMRETDDEAIRRSTVFVDTIDGAPVEAGDIVKPLESGAMTMDDIAADLFNLCRGEHQGRSSDTEITLFKSTGAALEDLAAARLVTSRLAAG